jgi:hypothetical protein
MRSQFAIPTVSINSASVISTFTSQALTVVGQVVVSFLSFYGFIFYIYATTKNTGSFIFYDQQVIFLQASVSTILSVDPPKPRSNNGFVYATNFADRSLHTDSRSFLFIDLFWRVSIAKTNKNGKMNLNRKYQ